MELPGITLGLIVALLWGSSDILATIAARRLSTFKITFVSQVTGLLGLFAFVLIASERTRLSFTPANFTLSALYGVFTGLCAALGYLALYRSLEIGPVAIVGPLTATSPIFTLILAALFLHERLLPQQLLLLLTGIIGIALASTNAGELRILLRKPGFSLWSHGVRWAVVATLAFGALDFGIGASAAASNWFLPALWTRFYTLLFLVVFSSLTYYRWRSSHQARVTYENMLKFSLPRLADITSIRRPSSRAGSAILLALAVGVMESCAVLTFSFDTRLSSTGITSAIASSYAIFVMLFGILLYFERLAKNQFVGIALFMVSLFLLAL